MGLLRKEHFRISAGSVGQTSMAFCWAMRFEIGLQMATGFACRLTRMPVLFLPLKGMLLLQDSAPNATDKCGATSSSSTSRTVRELRLKTKPRWRCLCVDESSSPHHGLSRSTERSAYRRHASKDGYATGNSDFPISS